MRWFTFSILATLLVLSSAVQARQTQKTDKAVPVTRRETIERRTVDAVIVSDPNSEQEHAFKGEGTLDGYVEGRRWRMAVNGWFSYEIKGSDKPLELVCTYSRPSDPPPAFDIIVDGEKIATESLLNHSAKTFDVEYLLPESLTRNKDRLTVKFRSAPNRSTGAVLDVRMAWADIQE